MQRQVGPLRSDAFAEWDSASSIDAHALFEIRPGATAATLLNHSWLMGDDTVQALQTKVEAKFATYSRQREQPFKRVEMWHDSPTRVPRQSVKSVVTLDYRNYSLTISSFAAGTVKIHCADCQIVEANGLVLELKGLTVDDGVADEAWSEILKATSPEEAQEWEREIAKVCQQAKSLTVRFQRLRIVQSRKRHIVHERLVLLRNLLDEANVWHQFGGLSTTSKNKLLRQLTKEQDKRVPGVIWAPEDTAQCQHLGCEVEFGIRFGIPHHMHHCRLCGTGVCGKHFVDVGARLPASDAHEGVPPAATEPLHDQTTPVERALGCSRLELQNTEVDVYSESTRCWVVGRISEVNSATGDVTVSYSGLPSSRSISTGVINTGVDDEPRTVPVLLKTIKANAASSIRLHRVTPWSEVSVPVCLTCKSLLRTVGELPEQDRDRYARTFQQIMSAMSDDYRTVKTAGTDAPSAALVLRKIWEARALHLDKIDLKSEAVKFALWLKSQAAVSPVDAAWEASMRAAGFSHSPRTSDGAWSSNVDMTKLVRNTINTMVEQVPGLKALILDEFTRGILAASFTASDLAEHPIIVGPQYLSTCLERSARHSHVRAIVWVRPTEDNIQQICTELQNPSFAEYHIFFSSRDEHRMNGFIERLAIADHFELVRGVSECLGGCVASSPEMFALEVAPTKELMSYSEQVRRLQSVLLSLGRQPIIRYSRHSERAAAVAQKLTKSMATCTGLDKVTAGGRRSVVIIIDRADDPFTPLMNQWTFLAMQHELLLEDGSCGSSRIRYTETNTGNVHVISTLPPDGSVEFESSFARRHMHDDWSVVCEGYERMKAQRIALKKEITRLNASGSLEDAQRAIHLIQRRDNHNHIHDVQCIPLVQELEKRATHQRAEKVSRLQVRLADCADASADLDQCTDHRLYKQHHDELTHMLAHDLHIKCAIPITEIQTQAGGGGNGSDSLASDIRRENVTQGIMLQRKRIILTFVLRYPRTAGKAWLTLCTREEKELVRFLQQSAQRFAAWIPLRECYAAKRFYETRWDLDPILTYRPRLEWTLHRLLHKKLSEQQYAFCCDGDEDELRTQRHAFARPEQLDVMVFFVGGITCQEARIVHEFNAEIGGCSDPRGSAASTTTTTDRNSHSSGNTIRFICGGDFITSANRYCAEFAQAARELAAADSAAEPRI